MNKFFAFVGKLVVQLLTLLVFATVSFLGSYLGGFMHDEVAVMKAVRAERQLVAHKLAEAKLRQERDHAFDELVRVVKEVNDTIEYTKQTAKEQQARRAAVEKKAAEAKGGSWLWASK